MGIKTDHYWMRCALELAQEAAHQGEVPVGAVLVLDDEVIGQGYNCPISTVDPIAHAEIKALQRGALHLNNYRLLNTRLYVTLEPCFMCAGAMVHARVGRLIYGAFDPKAGAIMSRFRVLELPFLNHRLAHEGGLLKEECGSLLSQFFSSKRKKQ